VFIGLGVRKSKGARTQICDYAYNEDLHVELRSYEEANKLGEIIWKEWKVTSFHIWHFVSDRGEERNRKGQNNDGGSKAMLRFIGTGI
jgi:hypothetical protein